LFDRGRVLLDACDKEEAVSMLEQAFVGAIREGIILRGLAYKLADLY
jgi:tetratricopeptide (TPR) repeat protein